MKRFIKIKLNLANWHIEHFNFAEIFFQTVDLFIIHRIIAMKLNLLDQFDVVGYLSNCVRIPVNSLVNNIKLREEFFLLDINEFGKY